MKKIEMASDMDEILKEEIREYKETLTCPSCKVTDDPSLLWIILTSASQVKRKDAILTKCFHAFCYDCLRTRYETRWKIQEQTKVTICYLFFPDIEDN